MVAGLRCAEAVASLIPGIVSVIAGARSADPAHFREVVERIRDSGCDVLINLTTGEGGRFVPGEDDPRVAGEGTTLNPPEVRVRHVLELRPDICTLDMGTMNFGEAVFMNTPGHLRRMAELIKDAGVKPELEVFDAGQIRLANEFIEQGLIETPPLFQTRIISFKLPLDSPGKKRPQPLAGSPIAPAKHHQQQRQDEQE